jgi:hypothetical protein
MTSSASMDVICTHGSPSASSSSWITGCDSTSGSGGGERLPL